MATVKTVNALYCESPQFNDDSIAQLRRLRSLETLYIAKATITDRSLASIGALSQLEVLHLCDTLITEVRKRALSGKLASCNIEYLRKAHRCQGTVCDCEGQGTRVIVEEHPIKTM